jgi:hypothetical protein
MFYRRLLGKAYTNGVDRVQKKLTSDHPVAVSIQLDGWSAHKHGFMGLIANYITKGWRRGKVCLQSLRPIR